MKRAAFIAQGLKYPKRRISTTYLFLASPTKRLVSNCRETIIHCFLLSISVSLVSVLWTIKRWLFVSVLWTNIFCPMWHYWHWCRGVQTWLCVTLWGRVRQADNLLVCFGAKPNKGLSPRSSTWPEVGKGTRERVGKRNPERRVGEGRRRRAVASRQRTAAETSRREKGSRGSEGRPVKMSQHSSWLVEISQKKYTSAIVYRCTRNAECHNLTFLHLS